jgi:membrane protein implicated in regulation of membrane protease activity
MAGYLYVICGIALIIASFVFNGKSFLLVLILSILTLMIIAPILYSYSLYRRNINKDTGQEE